MMAETIAMTKRVLKNLEVDSEELASDVIENVGPGNKFLTEKHTSNHYGDESWDPELFDRDSHDARARDKLGSH